VRNITRRSIPIPQPPVGGRPCSSLYCRTRISLWIHKFTVGTKRTHQRMSHRYPGPRHRPVPSVSPKSGVSQSTTDRTQNTHLLLESKALLERIVQFRISVAKFLATHEALESLAEPGSRTMPLGEGGHHLWMADCMGADGQVSGLLEGWQVRTDE
jgi:hypothetical protein